MLSKNEVKYIQSLGHKKRRAEERLFIAEGSKILAEFIHEMPQQIFRLYATEDFFQKHAEAQQIADKRVITDEDLQRISQLQTPNEALALIRYFPEQDTNLSSNGWSLALDGIRDPGNMGTIIRLADWFGIETIICSPDCADVYNSKVVQATMGSIMRVKIIEQELGDFLAKQNMPVAGAVLGGDQLASYQFPSSGILVIGNEANGISKELLPFLTQQVMIPRFGHAESLNAATATGILLWELKRPV
ncbi:MAG: RNA methyltransferase [Chitinophagaceae bacterium]|jgi:RNA methyltransferase, TrmH family|nr:RNA methyltransferase [Chitinophagaceae bacterium]